MSGRRPNEVPVGIFSEGTVRDEDVGNELADLLRPLHLSKADRQTVREWDALQNLLHDNLHQDRAYMLRARKEEAEADPSIQAELCAELWRVLDNYLPPFTYAGASEGDGACFGVWPDIEGAKEDEDVLKVGGKGQSDFGALGFKGLALDINERGNCALYRCNGRKWVEVWSVV